MNVRLHIDRLVLEGIDLAPDKRGALQAAVEQELARLIGTGGLEAAVREGNVPHVAAPSIPLRGARPEQLGTDIAGAVHRGLGGGR